MRTVRLGCSPVRKVAHGSNASSTLAHAAAMCKQLGCGANEPRLERHLAQAKSDTDFLVGDRRIVRREGRIEVPLVVRRAPFHGGLQQPFR